MAGHTCCGNIQFRDDAATAGHCGTEKEEGEDGATPKRSYHAGHHNVVNRIVRRMNTDVGMIDDVGMIRELRGDDVGMVSESFCDRFGTEFCARLL